MSAAPSTIRKRAARRKRPQTWPGTITAAVHQIDGDHTRAHRLERRAEQVKPLLALKCPRCGAVGTSCGTDVSGKPTFHAARTRAFKAGDR